MTVLTTATLCSGDKFVCTGGATGNVRAMERRDWEAVEPVSFVRNTDHGTREFGGDKLGPRRYGDGSVGLWNTESGDFQQSHRHTAEVVALCFGAGDENRRQRELGSPGVHS